MKWTFAIQMASLAASMLVSPAIAQTYEISWWTVDGGGVTFASGNAYDVGATAGQPDAGVLTGGAYALTGGFWTPLPRPDTVDPPPGEPGYDKVRHISFVPRNPGMQTALRVTLADLPAPFDDDEGCKLWVGPSGDVSEISGKSDATPPTFKRSLLQTTWHCMDWGMVGTLHVTDSEIVPSGRYDVQAIECTADPSNEGNYSDPRPRYTSKWGDIVRDCSPTGCSAPDGTVNFVDISCVVDKFKNLPSAPIKTRADVAPDVPDRIIDFVDIPSVVDAFKGLPYPYGGPDKCP
jgi:hypothetical protein